VNTSPSSSSPSGPLDPWCSAGERARAVASGDVSPVELVEQALTRIDRVQPSLGCFAHVWADDARGAAVRAAEAVVRGGPLGVLHGVPVAIKETTPVAGRRFTCGSLTQEHTIADRDGAIVRRLRAAGAVIVGATTSPEFAHTLVTDSPLWGVTRNPWDTSRTPGGSSGGSGAAVASGCVALAEGSDMGGSVRIPAAWCGVVGMKPGIGRIPMDVLPGLFDSLSHHGPLARCVDDVRLFLAATQGPDPADVMSMPVPLDLMRPVSGSVAGMRVGVSVELGCWAVDDEIAAVVGAAAQALAEAGAIVVDVDPRFTGADEWLWAQLWGVFMSAYYGHLLPEWEDRMDPDVVSLIRFGESMSATDHKRLEVARSSVWHRLAAVFAQVDVLLCPTMAQPPRAAAKRDHVQAAEPDDGRYHSDDMTAVFNLVAPCPAISVPAGRHAAGWPIGAQLVAPPWREDLALAAAAALERCLPPLGHPTTV
jgi:Asp-tRNA(Asn)/Glu-tRNA(Gln) amidotransferase A subunit family amidase